MSYSVKRSRVCGYENRPQRPHCRSNVGKLCMERGTHPVYCPFRSREAATGMAGVRGRLVPSANPDPHTRRGHREKCHKKNCDLFSRFSSRNFESPTRLITKVLSARATWPTCSTSGVGAGPNLPAKALKSPVPPLLALSFFLIRFPKFGYVRGSH